MNNYWKNKKVVVTGGAGFIGSHIVEFLVSNGAIVTVPISPKTSSIKIEKNLGSVLSKIIIKPCNLLAQEETISITKDQDCIFHFAALDGGRKFKMENSALLLQTNTRLGLNILEASKINNISKLLIISSIDIYAKLTKSVITESDQILIDPETDGYTLSKRYIEIAAIKYKDQYKMNIAIARLGNIYGPRDHDSLEKVRVIPTFINKIKNNQSIEIWGKGNNKLSFLYVKDLAPAILNLVEKYSHADPVNLVSSQYITLKKLAKLVSKLLNKKSNVILKPVDKKLIGRNKNISNKKAERTINFEEKYTLETGLQETIVSMQ